MNDWRAWYLHFYCNGLGQGRSELDKNSYIQDSFSLPYSSVSSLIPPLPQKIHLVLHYGTSKAIKIQPPSFLCLAQVNCFNDVHIVKNAYSSLGNIYQIPLKLCILVQWEKVYSKMFWNVTNLHIVMYI